MTPSTAGALTALGRATPKSLILNIYAAHVRDLGGWLAVSALLQLMADLGHQPAAVRAAISRMKRSALLGAQSRGGVAGYALTTSAMEILRDGDVRIFHSAQPASLADGWVVAVFSVPEAARERRHQLRARLIRLGFGQVAPGVWTAPRRMHGELARVLERSDLTRHTTVFAGEHLGFTDAGTMVERAWDLSDLEARYSEFVAAQRPGVRNTVRPGGPHDRQAFIRYMSVLSGWRDLAYSDPGLPAELLPPRWCGARAARRFTQLRGQLESRSHAHVRAAASA